MRHLLPGTMGGMRRRIFTIVSVFSLLVCLLMAGLWLDSYCSVRGVGIDTHNGEVAAMIHTGSLCFVSIEGERFQTSPSLFSYGRGTKAYDPLLNGSRLPLGFRQGNDSGGVSFVGVPLWLVCLLTCWMPAMYLRNYMRQ